jgi:hypothetical protein
MSAVTSRAVAQDLPLATGAQTTGGIVARIFVKLSHQDTKRDIVNYSLILYRANRDSTILTTEDGGRITMIVPAGDYQLVSVAPLAWSGGQYVWNVPLRVYAGMPALELNAGNAQAAPTPTFSRATPIFSRASPTTRNPLTGAVEPSDSAATPSLTAPAVICCMKDPAAAVLFSVIFPGGGQFYNGEAGKGVLFFVLEVGGIASWPRRTTTLAKTTSDRVAAVSRRWSTSASVSRSVRGSTRSSTLAPARTGTTEISVLSHESRSWWCRAR